MTQPGLLNITTDAVRTGFAISCPDCKAINCFVLVGKVLAAGTLLNHYVCPDPNCPGAIKIKPGGPK